MRNIPELYANIKEQQERNALLIKKHKELKARLVDNICDVYLLWRECSKYLKKSKLNPNNHIEK